MAKKSLDPNLAAILDSIRATVSADAPAPAGEADGTGQQPATDVAAGAVAPAPAPVPAPVPGMPQQTVEAFLADLIRPQVKAWLDARLPELVQQITAEEIARILNRH